jgi:hypothetical protein
MDAFSNWKGTEGPVSNSWENNVRPHRPVLSPTVDGWLTSERLHDLSFLRCYGPSRSVNSFFVSAETRQWLLLPVHSASGSKEFDDS